VWSSEIDVASNEMMQYMVGLNGRTGRMRRYVYLFEQRAAEAVANEDDGYV
jgi:hypothetical protein